MSKPVPPSAQRPHVFMVRLSGELSIKAKTTRNRFTNHLAANIIDALESAGIDSEVRRSWARIYITAASEEAAVVASRVFGVASVSAVEFRPWETLDDILQVGEEIFTPTVQGKSFAVRVRRGDRKKIPFGSTEVERELGSRLLPHAARVDLRQPEVTANIEIHLDDAYFSTGSLDGQQGLPIGEQGRAVALVSGGFDSIVAAWLLLRRGVMLDYVFCNLGGTPHRDGALRVMKVLSDQWSAGYRPRIHLVDFQPVAEELQERCPSSLWQILLKRQMLRAADQIAQTAGKGKNRASAIVTGESVGQVSSQTLQNLRVISTATELPILRPLAGANKDEIFERARKIGAYDLAALVPEYCGLVKDQPATSANLTRVLESEEALDPEHLQSLVRERTILDLRAFDPDRSSSTEYEVDEIPADATILDLRSRNAFHGWHYPEALHTDYFQALRSWRSLDRSKTYVIYCEVGLKSAHLAELMREDGFRASHVRDGLKTVKRLYESQDPALRALLSPVLLDPK